MHHPLENGAKTPIYDKRTILSIICLGGLFLLTLLLAPFTYSNVNAIKVRLISAGFVAFNVIPVVFIFRNENMTKFLVAKCALWIISNFAPVWCRR